jgi:3-oxoacyl-[acyl-carrier-protein] synthase-1
MCNGLGATTAAIVASLAEGRSGLAAPPYDLPFETVCGVVGALTAGAENGAAMPDSRIARIAMLALEDVRPALGRALRRWGPDRVGAVIGTSTGGLAETERAFAQANSEPGGRLPAWFDFERSHPFHLVVEHVCGAVGIAGPRYVVSTACSSSAKAFGAGARLLRAGVCDAVLVGGVDTLCQTTLRGFQALGVLASGPCRPFGRDRRGINIGEGGAFALLEREGDGPVRLLGVGESSDAYHMSSPDPEGLGARTAMGRALESAGLSASDIGHVNAHGTGTLQSDAAEARAIASLLGNGVPVSSTKGYTGHLLGAGGATEAVFSIVAIEHGFVPASLGADPLDPDITIRVATEKIVGPIRAVLTNSFAFGGSNATLLFGTPR